MITLTDCIRILSSVALAAMLIVNISRAQEPIRPVTAAPQSEGKTPAEQKIAAARGRTEQFPDDASAWSALALALSQRARETADHHWYVRADEAIETALKIDGTHFDSLRTRVWILLGQHQFSEARDLGLQLNKRNPDDVLLYGFLADACAELGLYDEAEKHVQRMLDMRPPSVASLSRTGYLREIFGNLDGALDVMSQAFRMTPPAATEDRAWLLTQIGHLYLLRGNLPMARQVLEQALDAFPGYHYTLAQMAKVETMEANWGRAVELLAWRYEIAPHPENLFDLAEALELNGDAAGAAARWKVFEKAALAESESNDNANREMIAYYAHIAKQPAKAAALAKREMERRQDVFTMLRAAEAHFANGDVAEARTLSERVLAIGYRDADSLYLAGQLADAVGEAEQARQLYAEANAFNPRSAAGKLAMERLLGGRISAVVRR